MDVEATIEEAFNMKTSKAVLAFLICASSQWGRVGRTSGRPKVAGEAL
jgi:hypothetical protein